MIVCRQKMSENIIYTNNYVLGVVLINFIKKDITLRALETKNTYEKCPTCSLSAYGWMSDQVRHLTEIVTGPNSGVV